MRCSNPVLPIACAAVLTLVIIADATLDVVLTKTITHIITVSDLNDPGFVTSESPVTSWFGPFSAAAISSWDVALPSEFCGECYDPTNPPPPSNTDWARWYVKLMNPYFSGNWLELYPDLVRSCGRAWTSNFDHWLATRGTTDTFTPSVTATPDWITISGSIYLSGIGIEMATARPEIEFTASPPCCSSCSFVADDAHVYHWPTDVPFSSSTLINAAGYTFIYPSIYVAFQTLGAQDLCGMVGSALERAITLGFDESQISTAISYTYNRTQYTSVPAIFTEPTFSAINLTNIGNCDEILTTYYFDSSWNPVDNLTVTTTGNTTSGLITVGGISTGLRVCYDITTLSFESLVFTYNPCSPWLSVPTQLATLSPEWSSCYRSFKPVRDPWGVLTASSGFYPVTTQDPTMIHPTQTSSASAGPSIPQSPASRTPLPVYYPTTRPTMGNPPLPISKVPVVATVGEATITANAESALVIGTQTLEPGHQIIYSNTVLSLAPNGEALIIGGTSTQVLSQMYALGTQTLAAGGPALTEPGSTYSVGSDGALIVIDGSAQASSSTTMVSNTEIQKIWVPGYVIGSQTLIAGGLPITSAETVLSLEPDGENIVIIVSKTEDINAWLGSSRPVETATDGIFASITEDHEGYGSSTTLSASETTGFAKSMRSLGSKVAVNVYTVSLPVIIAVIGIWIGL
ncbi:hypothetical protein N431DRAFT_473028 [Stipitochalara longipes BDJ]|nr:hypothetical protein N431DRAFT_473028 [Stipitochalara longipes BDJ]